MAYIGQTFDANTVAPQTEYQPLPAGDYEVMIVDSAMEQTKTGGQMLKLQMQVLSGQHQNAVLFDRINLVNSNPVAVEIGQRTLSAICHAVGVLQITDSSQLHNRPMIARVIVKPAEGNYGPSNAVRTYKAKGSAQPVANAFIQQQQAAPAPPAAPQPPTTVHATSQLPAGAPLWMSAAAKA